MYIQARNQCVCVDVESGQRQWITEDTENRLSAVALPGLGLVVGDYYIVGYDQKRRKVVAFSKLDGQVRWEYKGKGGFTSPPTFVDGKLIIGSDDQSVYCFEEAG